MPSDAAATSTPSSRRSFGNRTLRLILGLLAVTAFLAVVHNFGVNLLPIARVTLDPQRMTVYSPKSAFAFAYPYRESVPDDPFNQRSRVRLLENDKLLEPRLRALDEVTLVGGGRWSHLGDQIIFTTIDNSDPRTNGRSYLLLAPRCYSQTIGRIAVAVLLLSWGALFLLTRQDAKAARSEVRIARWSWHLLGATVLFGLGLYCNTGTMPPYANTTDRMAVKIRSHTTMGVADSTNSSRLSSSSAQ